jgi:hypothetical protein
MAQLLTVGHALSMTPGAESGESTAPYIDQHNGEIAMDHADELIQSGVPVALAGLCP